MHRRLAMLLAAAVVAAPCAALAQNPQPAPPGVKAPVAPPNSPSPPPEQVAPGAQNMQGNDPNLSNKLASQNGTLHPSNVDPGIAVTPPANGQGTMPVIPPPGTSGGNPNVEPK
ncbi:MAG TPA: hypothetical protein VGG99_29010 [Acetobacteraceae bacterium]|jgi:hypothetical protein